MTLSLPRLHRLLQDQGGTSITEFVIVLPIFLLIFAGIGRMYALQSTSTAIQLRATHTMWTRALDAQRQESTSSLAVAVNHANIAAASDDASAISQSPQATPAPVKVFMRERWARLKQDGSVGEVSLVHDRIRPLIRTFNLEEFDQTLNSAPGSPKLDFSRPPTTHTQLVSTATAQRLFNETAKIDPVTADIPPENTFFDSLRTINSSRTVAAANLRYGLAHAESRDTVDIFGVPADLSTGFDVLVSPISSRDPGQPARARAVVRGTLSAQDMYDSLLSIEAPKTFHYDSSY